MPEDPGGLEATIRRLEQEYDGLTSQIERIRDTRLRVSAELQPLYRRRAIEVERRKGGL